jgi:hypothetical protein
MTLTEFLTARLDEDEAEARAAFSGQVDPLNGWGVDGRAVTPHVGVVHEDVQRAHIVKWNPARVLDECEAKRRLLVTGDQVLRALAAVYKDHPDYQREWA